MRAISFKLSGKTACFKKPDVNQFAYFTYNNIHKPALLGLLGAISGYGGHTQLFNENSRIKEQNKTIKNEDDRKLFNNGFPEYYEKLKDLKVSIIPLSSNGYFSKKIQTFNNSVGYASKETGGNLIVREQWLENPIWQIMVLDNESEEYNKLKSYLQNSKTFFIPYLGKNDHPAKIDEIKMIDLSESEKDKYIDSLFIKNYEKLGPYAKEGETAFLFQEVSPLKLQEEYHFYEYETLVFTNYELKKIPENTYKYDEKQYSFI